MKLSVVYWFLVKTGKKKQNTSSAVTYCKEKRN